MPILEPFFTLSRYEQKSMFHLEQNASVAARHLHELQTRVDQTSLSNEGPNISDLGGNQ